MNWQASDWYRSLTLKERLSCLRAAEDNGSEREFDIELARNRLHRWRSQPTFSKGFTFSQRLQLDRLKEDELLQVLGEPIERVRDRCSAPPDWLQVFVEAYSYPNSPDDGATTWPGDLSPQIDPRKQKEAHFLSAIEPLLERARKLLHQKIEWLTEHSPIVPFHPDTMENHLFGHLPQKLVALVDRTFVLELNVARIQGLLKGYTPEERFQYFLHRLSQSENALALFQEYPVLARLLTQHIDNWLHFSFEFLERLCTDWASICSILSSGSNPGLCVGIEQDLGSQGRGGTVSVVTFSSGFRVVYKPRSLAVDCHFQDLLEWLNKRGATPQLKTLKILDFGTHGWVQFIEPKPCQSVAELQRFYERQGAYLALLHTLEARDMHYENLIAVGEHPMLVDLEVLFSQSIQKQLQRERVEDNHPHALTSAIDALESSVLQVDLMPMRIRLDDESEGIDISGLGGKEGQLSPEGVPYWEGMATDEMRLVRQQVSLQGGKNRPTLDGREVDLLDFAESIATGYSALYQLLVQYRDELLTSDGPLGWFAEDEVRFLQRSNYAYSLLLKENLHPNLLRNALDRDRFLEQLWGGVESYPELTRVIPYEQADLHDGFLPKFSTTPTSRDLWSSSREQISGYFTESGMTRVQHRLQHMSSTDMNRQLWIVRASLASLSEGTEALSDTAYPSILTQSSPQTERQHEQFLSLAQAIGDRLEALAIYSDDQHSIAQHREVAWLGLSLQQESFWSLQPLGLDLRDGLPGVALFLAYLGQIAQEPRFTDLAETTLVSIQAFLRSEQDSVHLTSIGGFQGWGGIIYMLTHLGSLWERTDLWVAAEEIAAQLATAIEQDEQLDLVGGAAGCLISLTNLYRCSPSATVLSAALQCGEHLLQRSQFEGENGRGRWLVPPAKKLATFSGGTAGIAGALLELTTHTHDTRFRDAAIAAVQSELETTIAPQHNEFRSERTAVSRDRDVTNSQWHQSEVGIGRAQLQMLPYLNHPALRAEIEAIVQATDDRGFGFNHSLGYGDLGNLDFLLQASGVLGQPHWAVRARQISTRVLANIEQCGLRCGVPLGTETPGLMTGLAGIGYGLLRLAEPKQLPSILTLSPPL